MSSLNYSEFCRLCLVKERVSTPIFEGEGDVRRIFLKIATCLPIKVSREDHLPKSICDDCLYKVENQYQFWNTTANSEKQLHQWLGSSVGDSIDVKNIHGSGMDPMEMKQESMDMDQGSELSKSLSRVEAVLAEEAGRVAAAAHGEDEDEEEEESEEEGSNSEESEDDDNDADEPNKDEDDEDEAYDEELEPTTFVNVSLACDEAGPSGTQQQTSVAPSTSTSAPAASGSPIRKLLQRKKLNVAGAKEQLMCSICGDTFLSALELNNHVGIHRDERPFKCDMCSRAFKRIQNLCNHKKLHTLERVHKCDMCDYATKQKFNLKIHLKRHLDEFRYNCSSCNKGFHTNLELQNHIVGHTGELPYQCEECGVAYRHKYQLAHHKDTHNPSYTPPKKEHQCRICHKLYSHQKVLRVHLRSHSGQTQAVCDICGKTVASKSYLKVHLRTHTGERPNVCVVCGKAFNSKTYLRIHNRCHTGERPFSCEICQKTFTQQASLITHNKKAHAQGSHNLIN